MNKKANSIDDKQGMERAVAQANEDYKAVAPHTSGEDTAATKALKNYYEQVGHRYSLYEEAMYVEKLLAIPVVEKQFL